MLLLVLLQENASRPDHVPPNQGGKYVGFGSTPPPAPRRGPGGNPSQGGEDVGAYLSKGLSQLSTAAGDLCPCGGWAALVPWVVRGKHSAVPSCTCQNLVC